MTSETMPDSVSRSQEDAQHLQSFVRLLTEHQGGIRAYIVSLIPGSPDVGDVLQETNLVMWNKRQQFQPGSNFVAWAFAIARFEVMHCRNRRAGRLMFSDELIESLAASPPAEDGHEDYLQALDRCMDKLNTRQRDLIEHRYTPGKSLEEYARRGGQGAGGLRIALLRIRKILRQCIESQPNVGRA
jgi:RNA polymerase sigma-70 factor (ECF subfamily)